MTRRSDAHRLLTRALYERAVGSGAAVIAASSSQAWASATFRGARHQLSLAFNGDDAADRAAALARDLDRIEFRLTGHLVADISVAAERTSADGVTMEIEALTVEDG